MRPLSDEEMRQFFEKLRVFLGDNLPLLIDRKDAPHTFRLIKDRVYYINEEHLKLATNISRENLMSIGVCFGKFTKSVSYIAAQSCIESLGLTTDKHASNRHY